VPHQPRVESGAEGGELMPENPWQRYNVHFRAAVKPAEPALAPAWVDCPNPLCMNEKGLHRLLRLGAEERRKALWNLRCPHCKWMLAPNPDSKKVKQESRKELLKRTFAGL
jgi:hypothetical protein